MMIEIQCPECGAVRASSGDQFQEERKRPNEATYRYARSATRFWSQMEATNGTL